MSFTMWFSECFQRYFFWISHLRFLPPKKEDANQMYPFPQSLSTSFTLKIPFSYE